MAAKQRGGREAGRKARRQAGPRKKATARKRITARKEKRGLEGVEVLLALDAPEVAPLVAEVEAAGGAPIGAYREPLSGRPLLLASLPIDVGASRRRSSAISRRPTPSVWPQKIEESGSFLDPAHRRARRRRSTLDAERTAPAGRRPRCSACGRSRR